MVWRFEPHGSAQQRLRLLWWLPLLWRVSDDGCSRWFGWHRGRRPKASKEGTRGRWGADDEARAMAIWSQCLRWKRGARAWRLDDGGHWRVSGSLEHRWRCASGKIALWKAVPGSCPVERRRGRVGTSEERAWRCGCVMSWPRSWGVDPDCDERHGRPITWFAAGLEGLDHEHAAATARTGLGEWLRRRIDLDRLFGRRRCQSQEFVRSRWKPLGRTWMRNRRMNSRTSSVIVV